MAVNRLLVMEEFENELLPKIVPLPFGKTRSKSTTDLPSRGPSRIIAKK